MNGKLPAVGKVSLPDIPDELKGYNQWLVWRYEKDPNPGAKKDRKVPYSPLSMKPTGHDEKSRPTWGSFDQAVTAYGTERFSGIGFVFTKSDPYVGVDLDHCAFNGQPDSWAEEIINQLNTYTEVSPSGTGFHMLMVGKKPGTRCKPPRRFLLKNEAGEYIDDIEVYESSRYFTVTGKVFGSKVIQQNQDALVEVYREQVERDLPQLPETDDQPQSVKRPAQRADESAFSGSGGIKYDRNGRGQEGYWKIPDDDGELLAEIEKSKQKDKFLRWYNGDLSMNANNHSDADFAFCGALAFWTGKNAERMDRIFRDSQLMRPKWDERRGEKLYGQMTIDKAIGACKEVYKGKFVSVGPQGQGSASSRTDENNVVKFPKKKAVAQRTVHITETGFNHGIRPPRPDEIIWPETGNYYHISDKDWCLRQGNFDDGSQLEIIALRAIWIYSLAEDDQEEVYRVIKFYNHNLQLKEVCIPQQWFSKTKDANVWSALLAQGMLLLSGKEKFLARYLDITASQCIHRSWAASKLGWFEVPNAPEKPVFVLPHTILGNTGDNREVFFQQLQKLSGQPISPKGTLLDWKREIASRAKGNSLIMFAICASFAGSLTKLANVGSGGFHFWGAPRCGKTILVQAAASVWGNGSDPQIHSSKTSIRKWNATGNALEATAQLHNDIVLCLDEIGELDNPQDLNRLIYSLVGGSPKGRMQDVGGLRAQAFWHIMLLSTGELSTEAVLKSAGFTKRGGQTHRLPDIRVDALENGIVERDDVDPVDFTNQLKRACSLHYGTAGPVFVHYLIKSIQEKGYQEFVNEVSELVNSMEVRLLDTIEQLAKEAREIRAVLKRMAAIAVAGFYASEAGILDWTPEQINDAVVGVRNLWLSDMGEHISELDKALANLRNNLIVNMANFESINEPDAKTPIKLMGYHNIDYLMVLPGAFDDFCGSYSKRQLLKVMKERNYLEMESDRVAKKIPARVTKKERPRCYWISRNFLDD